MMRPFVLYGCGGLLVVGLLGGALASYRDAQSPNAWDLDATERIVSDFTPAQEVKAQFRLRNTGKVPRRILGGSIC